ncbi:MAG TPA: hypothetical protein VEC06_03095, partial [Paucimonas sp.]|nr:hypothetical protein [Paucimonas sp.]
SSGHDQIVQAVLREWPAGLPAWFLVFVAYILLASMICLEHEITDTPASGDGCLSPNEKAAHFLRGPCSSRCHSADAFRLQSLFISRLPK